MVDSTAKYVPRQEAYGKTVFDRSDDEIKDLAKKLHDYRIEISSVPNLSVTETQTLIVLCSMELNARASSKLAKIAIAISLVSIILSGVLAFVG